MNDSLLQGLILSATGLGLTFAALGLFVLVIVLLQRLFMARPTAPAGEAAPPEEPVGGGARDGGGQEIAAAIFIALCHLQAQEARDQGLGEALADGPGAWWSRRAAAAVRAAGRQSR